MPFTIPYESWRPCLLGNYIEDIQFHYDVCFVASQGNRATGLDDYYSHRRLPADSKHVISVASCNNERKFSREGNLIGRYSPTLDKPDILAPGEMIQAAGYYGHWVSRVPRLLHHLLVALLYYYWNYTKNVAFIYRLPR